MLTLSVTGAARAACPRALHPLLRRLESSEIGRRFASGAFWSLLGAVASRLLMLGAYVAMARILGKADYGRFGTIQSTLGMFGVFAGFGLGITANKHIAELRDKDPVRAGRIMGLAGAVAATTAVGIGAALFGFAPWLAARTLNAPEMGPLLRIGALVLVFEAMNGAQAGALAGFEAFRTTARISMGVGLVGVPMLVLGVVLGRIEGSVWALAANRALSWLLHHLALRREARKAGVPFSLHGSLRELSVLWNYSLPSMLAGVMVSPTIWICNAMLVNRPEGFDQMGILQANRSFQQVLLFIGATLGAPLLPMLSNMNGAGRRSDRLARVNMLSSWALGILPALVLSAVPEIGQLVFGRDYAGRDFTITYLLTVFSTGVMIYKQGLARAMSARGMMWWCLVNNVAWAAILVVCTRLFIARGAVGFAIAWALTYVLNTLLFLPLYVGKRLVPARTIVSPEAGLIWLALSVVTGLSLLQVPLGIRLLVLPVMAVAVCGLFWRLFQVRDTDDAGGAA